MNCIIGNLDFYKSKICRDSPYCHIAVFTDGSNITYGVNSTKKRFKNKNITTHAEIQALNNLRYILTKNKIRKTKVDLYVFRFLKNGDLSLSAPCHHCSVELSKNKYIEINNLYYSVDNGLIKIKFNDWLNFGQKIQSKGWKYCNELRK
jgi:tRNA(Arg) A34 adenosine deaminase TadA